ncbi:MAG: TolC family protein [Acidobacteria bacterium]|nr:TolC family protein [Acidobacteriota bacterium]
MLILIRMAFGILLLTLVARAPARTQELTEKEAVTLLSTQSPRALQLRSDTAVVEAETQSWHLWPNPEAGFDHEGAGLTQVGSVQQALPLNGRLGLLRQAGSMAVQVARLKADNNVWALCSDMRQAFYGLVLSQEQEGVLRESVGQMQEVVRILRERESHGEGSTFDRLRAEREQTDLQAELLAAEAATAKAKARLTSFFDRNIDFRRLKAQGQFGNETIVPPISDLVRLALQRRADYQAEEQQQAQLEWERQAATRLRIPEPVFFAGLKRAEEPRGIGFGPHIGFSLSIPIFDRGQARVAKAEAELRRSQFHRRALEQQIVAEVEGAYQAFELRRRAADQYRRQVEEQGPQLEQIAEVAYQEGELGILELLDAYRVRRQSKLRALELAAAAKEAEIELERGVGEFILNQGVLL